MFESISTSEGATAFDVKPTHDVRIRGASQTVEEAQQELYDNRVEGMDCPCCKRDYKIAVHSLNNPMARLMIALYWTTFHNPKEPDVHLENLCGAHGIKPGSCGKLVHWGLTERPTVVDKMQDSMRGKYRITQLGVRWVQGVKAVRADANVAPHNETMSTSGGWVYIRDALGKKFKYDHIFRQMEVAITGE